MEFTIDPHERWCVLGKTGSGKTEWVKFMLRLIQQRMPIVIVDPKEDWLGPYPEWETKKKLPGTVDKPHLVRAFNPKFHVQIYQPDEESDEAELDKFCLDVLKKRNIFFYVDETEGLCTAQHVPLGIRKLWKTGRSRGIGAWVATQTPSGIPKIFKSQAEHFVTFKVGAEDTDLAAQIGHAIRDDLSGLGKYEYLYYNPGMDFAEWQSPIPYEEKHT